MTLCQKRLYDRTLNGERTEKVAVTVLNTAGDVMLRRYLQIERWTNAQTDKSYHTAQRAVYSFL